jgi:Flp pilus assembly pilin Flp
LLLGLVTIAAAGTLGLVGTDLNAMYNAIQTAISTVPGA